MTRMGPGEDLYPAEGASTMSAETARDTGSDETAICVHVCGEVRSPGLYRLAAGSRAGDAVEAAGGLTKDADECAVNLAALVEDGQQVLVPSRDAAGSDGSPDAGTGSQAGSSGKININTADAAALTSLKGIGASRADAVIEYREKNGPFSDIEDITSVPGIGQGIYDRIKDSITV